MSEQSSEGAFRVLRHRDFRIFWLGHALSSIGTRMQEAALLWHLYTITNSAYALGAIGLVRVVPMLALSLVGVEGCARRDLKPRYVYSKC